MGHQGSMFCPLPNCLVSNQLTSMLVVSPFDKGLHVGQGIAGEYIDLSRMGLLCHHAVLLPKKTEISIQDHC